LEQNEDEEIVIVTKPQARLADLELAIALLKRNRISNKIVRTIRGLTLIRVVLPDDPKEIITTYKELWRQDGRIV